MYLRTTKRKNKDGSYTEYYQLAHNTRHPKTKNPVPQVIHSFGRADQLDRDALIRLCRSIARVCDLEIVDLKEAGKSNKMKGLEAAFDSVKLIKTVEFGTIEVIKSLWKKLGIGEALRSIDPRKGKGDRYEQALLAMVANRLCEPESKLGVWDRWLSKVYLPTCDCLKLDDMYEAMDYLYAHSEEIEKIVFNHTANLYNLEVDLIFYDTTTASFSIDHEDEDLELDVSGETEVLEEGLRKYGHSKEGTWTPQVVVALAVTRCGIPVRCWVFPGNTADVSTVKRVRDTWRFKTLEAWPCSFCSR